MKQIQNNQESTGNSISAYGFKKSQENFLATFAKSLWFLIYKKNP
jgi:hypothetical protein